MSAIRPILPVILATIFNIVGMGMVVPGLPFHVTSHGGETGVAPLIFSAFSAAAVLGAPVWGWLSDRMGRKPVLLASALLTALSYLWLANVDSLTELYASRIFAGLMAGWFAASMAYIADVTAPADRAKGMGMLGASFGIGFTIGPALGAWAVGGDNPAYALPAYAAAVCTAICALITLFFVREPERHSTDRTVRFATDVLRNADISKLLVLHFTVHLVFTAMEGVFAIWAAVKFGLGAREVGFYLAYAGLVTVIVQGGIVRRIVPVLGEGRVILIAVGLLMLTMAAVVAVSDVWMILIPMGLLAVGISLHNPAMQSLLSQVAPDQMKGGTMGNAQSAQSLARVAGPAWGAAAFSEFGPDSPFLMGFVILAGAFVFALFLSRRFTKAALASNEA
ncbi:MAG: MFS transporter [Alphaproteobacteria bacterium]|nr:MFS transporter [Alphaproteobacteria bacterium]MBO6863083.1 MFS transporter [Alphaproteobacteria bacterium]